MMLSLYSWALLLGIAASLAWWWRLVRRDSRLLLIYLAALAGAFLGAKVVYFLAEGYLHLGAPDMWLQLATGKSILGGLLGGYAAVELAKRWLRYPNITGDWFAVVVPLGILLGRIGCLVQGCCQGIVCDRSWFTVRDASGQWHWPAVPVEILFNVTAIVCLLVLRKRRLLPGQHFHLYLIAYGAFRFLHEFAREEPKLVLSLSGYQFAALALLAFGVIRFSQRRSQFAAMASDPIGKDESGVRNQGTPGMLAVGGNKR
jgi:phosphatidylglycerol:prolipoprotein diacylglycerol transferase